MTRTLSLLILVGALAIPNIAEACACCDGGEERTILAWSASGRSALVEMRTVGCVASAAYEIWEVGHDAPVRCFDRYGDPERAIACDALVDAWDVHDGGPEGVPLATSRRLATRFPQPARPLASTHLHATLTPAPDPEDSTARRVRLEVLVMRGSSTTGTTTTGATATGATTSTTSATTSGTTGTVATPRVLTTRELYLGRPEDYSVPEEEERTDDLISVRVWPSPNGRDAIVEVNGENADPGTGFFPVHLSFVRLDESTASLGTVERTSSVLAAPAYAATSPNADARRDAARFIRRGLALHRTGDFASSSTLFAWALMADPSSVGARYDLACALARLGRPAAALALLTELRVADCRRCRVLLRRATTDPDLESVRALLP